MGNPVQTLAWGLIQAAKRLDDAARYLDDKEGLLAAVRVNWKLWTIIQADILDDASPLPFEVRQSLLNLSNFIDKHTVGIITTPDAAKLDSLVEINKNIAAGLFDSLRIDASMIRKDAEAGTDQPLSGLPEEKISTSA